MRVAIIRRAKNASFSMDVYADGLVHGLRAVRPDWEVVELAPTFTSSGKQGNPLLKGLRKYYHRYWHYPAMVRQCHADIFHIIDHSDGHLVDWLKDKHQPIIVTCHDLINFLQPENISDQAYFPALSSFIWQWSVKKICRADHLVTVSTHTLKDVEQLLKVSPDRLTVVPNAVDTSFHPLPPAAIAAFRAQHSIDPETICLLNVGSDHPRKNVSTVLEAVAALVRQGIPVHLLKAGADFTTEQKQFLQEHSLGSHVTYLGKPERSTLVQIYGAADVLVAPSLYEGFGMTILEAMACSTAVITSNVTSLPEVAGDAAILVDPRDVGAIVKAVCLLQEDQEFRKQLISKGLARANCFTWEKVAEQVATLYEAAVSSTCRSEQADRSRPLPQI
jgi:glycosyltransferase involved in cell wall biosynthesis